MKSLRFLCVFTLLLVNSPLQSSELTTTEIKEESSNNLQFESDTTAADGSELEVATETEVTSTQPSLLRVYLLSWFIRPPQAPIDTTAADTIVTPDFKPVVQSLSNLQKQLETEAEKAHELQTFAMFQSNQRTIKKLENAIATSHATALTNLENQNNIAIKTLDQKSKDSSIKSQTSIAKSKQDHAARLSQNEQDYNTKSIRFTTEFDKKIADENAKYNKAHKEHNAKLLNLNPTEQSKESSTFADTTEKNYNTKCQSLTTEKEQTLQQMNSEKIANKNRFESEHDSEVERLNNEQAHALNSFESQQTAQSGKYQDEKDQIETDFTAITTMYNKVDYTFTNQLHRTLSLLQYSELEDNKNLDFDRLYYLSKTYAFFQSPYEYQANENGMQCKDCTYSNGAMNTEFKRKAPQHTVELTEMIAFGMQHAQAKDGIAYKIGIQECTHTKSDNTLRCKTIQENFEKMKLENLAKKESEDIQA